MSNLLIVSCTAKADKADTLLYKSLKHIGRKNLDVEFVTNNCEGLPKVYNRFINDKLYSNDVKRILFVHDDVWIDDCLLEYKLCKAMELYDIVGVAGTLNPKIVYPSLWHIMGERADHRGYAGHLAKGAAHKQGDPMFMTSFGETPSRAAIVDGLFVAINLSRISEVDWRWNENFDFHHYDIAGCLDANSKGLKVGVYPINIFHASPGLKSLSDIEWSKSHNKFFSLYN
jgi:hypothetical protein